MSGRIIGSLGNIEVGNVGKTEVVSVSHSESLRNGEIIRTNKGEEHVLYTCVSV
jgi:hypothetical protein